mmetsp:Transcript_126289/g.342822  ORF Transcript_126289/g.342822 Transcript_126289/m.342822 type:complete len:212 (-) Transcript_126289:775-1410(-)
MVINVLEILLSLLGSGCSETLVVLDLPSFAIVVVIFPVFVFFHGEELLDVASFRHLDDRRHKLLYESFPLEERGPPVLHQIQDQALNVRTIVVLISHDHDVTIAHPVRGRVVLLWFDAQNFGYGRDLGVGHSLPKRGLAHIEQLAAEREHTEAIPADDAEAGNRKGLGAVPLGEDQGAIAPFAAAGEVGVLQLGDSEEPLALPPAGAGAAS